MIIGILVFAYGIAGAFSAWNMYNACAARPKGVKTAACLTVLIGGLFYSVLHIFRFDEAGDWQVQIDTMQVHNSISSVFGWFAVCVIVLGLAGFFTLLFADGEKLPPLISALSSAALILLNLFQIAYAVQIAKNATEIGVDLLFYFYHGNILILSVSVLRKHAAQQVEAAAHREKDMQGHKVCRWLYARMTSLPKYTLLTCVCLFFLLAVLEILFVLAGQGLDAPVKAFTDTADWTFSKQIPPPPIDYTGHYLCTIAAGGHEKVVKPLRLGTRGGKTIVVNRQLCVANAFEEAIQERFPRFHKHIRHFYDTYGYPVSRHITSPLRADIVYILMKPLEWVFLLLLYTVDVHPEQRISRQYRYCK